MIVFLTGGTGFIGQRLVAALVRHDIQVIALVRRETSREAKIIAELGAKLVQGDVTNQDSMRLGMEQADTVIHNAGVYELGIDGAGVERMNSVNIGGTQHTLSLARELDKRAFYISTTWAYGASSATAARDESTPRSRSYATHYERTKKEAHRIALELGSSGLRLTTLCPNAVIGANDHASLGYLLRMYLLKVLPPLAWSPEVMLSLIHLEDLCEGIVQAVQRAKIGETYFLGGEAHSRQTMLEYWKTHDGGAKSRAWLAPNLLKTLFLPLEPLQRAVGLPAVFSKELVEAGQISLFDSSQKAKADFGFTHRSAKAMWDDTIAAEKALLAQRTKRDLVSLLKPM